jgi:hypothetical protein
MWMACLRRELISIPAVVFQMLEKHQYKVIRWWPSAKREVKLMGYSIPLMCADLGAPPAPYLFASDAEGANWKDAGGYGIVGAQATTSQVEAAIAATGTHGYTVARLDGSLNNLKDVRKELKCKIPVSKVPREILESRTLQWKVLDHRRWRMADHITLGEGRATVRLLQLLARFPETHRCVVACLEDNEPWAAAVCKGRSPKSTMNRLLRIKAGLGLATDIKLSLPWVDTKHQPADWISRVK